MGLRAECQRHRVPGLLEQVLREVARQPPRLPAHAGIGPDRGQLVVHSPVDPADRFGRFSLDTSISPS